MSIFGTLLLVCGARLLGNFLAKEEEKRLKSAEALLALLKYMQRKISVFRCPLSEIFSGFENVFLEEAGFFHRLSLGGKGWERRFSGAISVLPLENEIVQELNRFGSELGRLSLPEQEKRIADCISLLEREQARLKAAVPAKQKSVKVICTLAGAVGAIILL